jgi:hypothetical protein
MKIEMTVCVCLARQNEINERMSKLVATWYCYNVRLYEDKWR